MKKLISSLFITSFVLTTIIAYAQSDSVLIDPRDGKAYKVVTIGSQTWTAQNMNYATSITSTNVLWNELLSFLKEKPWTKEKSVIEDFIQKHHSSFINLFFCYMDSLKNCEKYGVLYTWESAQEACPAGWHLPSEQDYQELLTNFDGDRKKSFSSLSYGGDSGFESLFGGESFGFDIGYENLRNYRKYVEPDFWICPFRGKDNTSRYWTSTKTTKKKNGREIVARLTLSNYRKKAEISSIYLGYDFASSVRCVKNK